MCWPMHHHCSLMFRALQTPAGSVAFILGTAVATYTGLSIATKGPNARAWHKRGVVRCQDRVGGPSTTGSFEELEEEEAL